MEESEKTVALKKAYADMILNTAQEAAARVIASERKAHRFQHQLFAAKNEALRLLLHLKQMIDAKATEAEISSTSQQAKIDELEAQLQEAEGVIVDLRAELNWTRNKLEKARNPDTNNTLHNQKNMENTYLSEEQVEHQSVPQFGSHTSHGAELHRNGCTQRIPAAEKDLLEGQLPLNTEPDENSFRKCESKGSSIDHCKSRLPIPMTKKKFTREEVRKRVVRTSRRRTRFRKFKNKYRSCSSQLIKSHRRPSIPSRCVRNLGKANVVSDECSLQPIKADSADATRQSSKLVKELHCPNVYTVDKKTSTQLQCNSCSHTLLGNVKLPEDQLRMSKNEVKMKPLPRLDPGLTLIKGGVDPISGSANLTVSVKAVNQPNFLQKTSNKGLELLNDAIQQEHKAAAVNATLACLESNPHIVNVPVVYSAFEDLKSSKEGIIDVTVVYSDPEDAKSYKESKSDRPLDNNRLLKYTFQRKRRREASISPDQHTCIETCPSKRRAEGKLNGSAELEKSGKDGDNEDPYCLVPARRKLNLIPI